MPCNDWPTNYSGGYSNTEYNQVKTRLDKLTKIVCSSLRWMEENASATLPYLFKANPELRDWWNAHKEHDRRREEAERRAQEQKRKQHEEAQERKAVIAKLTPRERKLLGL